MLLHYVSSQLGFLSRPLNGFALVILELVPPAMSEIVVTSRDNRNIVCQNALRILFPQLPAVFILPRALRQLIRSDSTPCLEKLTCCVLVFFWSTSALSAGL